MRYPFSPEFLDALPEELAELFRELELFLLGEICDRLKLSEKLNEVTVQDIRVLRSHGIDLEAIKKAIAETSEVSLDKVNALLDDVVQRNQTYFDDLVSLAQVTKPQRYIDKSDVEAIRRQTLGEFKNLTQSLGFLVTQNGKRVMLEPAEAYQWALDRAETHIMSGGVSYNQAIRDAVKELADSGIQRVDYESGHTDHADVAARRAIMTGVNQLCDKYAEQSAEYLDTNYYEISAHIGARDVDGPNGWENHKAWQGKVYSIKSPDIYPNIYEVCGLGAVDGLNGANCRHKRFAWIEGVSERTWTDEQLAHIDDGHDCDFQGRHYTAYQATQKQRMIERTVRKLKREEKAFKAAGLKKDAQDVRVRIRALNEQYVQFSKAAGLPLQKDRMKVLNNTSNRGIVERKLARGRRMPVETILTDADIQSVLEDADALQIDRSVLLFNKGKRTGFLDDRKKIQVRGDIFPDLESNIACDRMSKRAVLAHEYYGHYMNDPSEYKVGDWRDEYRASRDAALNAPNLSAEDRALLMIDAYDRAKAAGEILEYDEEAKRIIYGYDG